MEKPINGVISSEQVAEAIISVLAEHDLLPYDLLSRLVIQNLGIVADEADSFREEIVSPALHQLTTENRVGKTAHAFPAFKLLRD